MLPALILAAAADLQLLSLKPVSDTVQTDETFTFLVQVRNDGPDAASNVMVAAGGNALTLLQKAAGPEGWTCDSPPPRFGYGIGCKIPRLGANEDATFKITMAAPQPSAMTYRLSAAITSDTPDPEKRNDQRHVNMSLVPSRTHAELSMTAQGTTFEIRNDGPDDAHDLTAIILGAREASSKGWQCAPNKKSVVCTRALLRANETSAMSARGTRLEARVRAEKIYDSNAKNNGTKSAFELNAREREAFDFLLTAERLEMPSVGIDGRPSQGYMAMRILGRSPDADAAFKELLHSGTMAGQLYGLIGVRRTDRAYFDKTLNRYAKSKADVTTFSGCIVMANYVAPIVRKKGAYQLADGRTITEWESSLPEGPMPDFDIAGGTYTSMFLDPVLPEYEAQLVALEATFDFDAK